MKQFGILISALAIAIVIFSYTTPRYSTRPNGDNTGRVLTWGQVIVTDTLGATPDTVTLPSLITSNGLSNYHTDLTVNLKDSMVLSFSSVASCHYGDELVVAIENGSASGWVQFIGYSGLSTKWEMASTGTKISPAASKRAVVTFWYDGTSWLEKGRSIH